MMPPRLRLALLVLILAAGCGRPPLALADKLQGAWVVQKINGEPVPEALRDRVAVIFFPDGQCQRGGDVGTFEVIDDVTIRTRLVDRVEDVNVDVVDDTVTMRTAEGIVTVLARVSQ